jgi:hypothetical protein
MIEIKSYTASQLQSLIDSDEFERMPVIPISHHRAISHMYNPRAKASDILLLTAWKEDVMVGYLGLIPDYIPSQNLPVSWMSCIWVDPGTRGMGIAKKLTLYAYEVTNQSLILTEYTPEAGALYLRLGIFSEWTTLTGRRYYLHSPLAKIIPDRKPKLKALFPFLKAIDALLNIYSKIKRQFYSKSRVSMTDFNEFHTLRFENDSTFGRSNNEFRWIDKYPWILYEYASADRYHFSSIDRDFKYRWVSYQNQYLMFTLRKGHLRVPYVVAQDFNLIALVIASLAEQYDVSTITIYDSRVLEHDVAIRSLAIASKTVIRSYLATASITQKVSMPKILDGDGDCAFT